MKKIFFAFGILLIPCLVYSVDKVAIVTDETANKVQISGQKIEVSTVSVFQLISTGTVVGGDFTTTNGTYTATNGQFSGKIAASGITATGNYTSVNSSITLTNGAIGIGTSSPSQKIDVVGSVEISTGSEAGTELMVFGGVLDALPTTGYGKNSIIIISADSIVYIATETVAGDYSWKKIGEQ